MCAPAIKLDVLMFAWFFGIVVTVLWVPRFSDKRSRKFFQGMAVISDLVMYTVLLLTKSYGLTIIVLFCMGMTGP